MPVIVETVTEADYPAWDEYVFHHLDGTFCHLVGWKSVIEKGAGQSCPYLVAKSGNDIVGVLPLTIKKHPLFGKALISNMFCVYGGALASSKEIGDRLVEEAWIWAQKTGLPILEIRSKVAQHDGDTSWVPIEGAATFSKDLAADDEAQLLAIPRKQRAVIRKSLKNNLRTRWTDSVDEFYELYARSVWSLGTPVFPKKLFASLVAVFGDRVAVQLTEDCDGRPVASLMSFFFKDTVMPYYAGGGTLVRKYAAHDFMYYQLMLAARQKGCTQFDFGRSKIDTGPYKFKKNWGFEPQPLGYEMRLADGVEPPNLSQQSGPYATLSNYWKKMPFGVSKLLGPPLARHLG
ncbi:MAG: FemAB family PEP-CTERM system-associated protein [Kordiimonadaceae bacterium]|nr:FemAB family PEP-CTERM system-associated protein [Kordiimonadaceae bacterium]MBO6570422.1 FemAB family PEP-CTERM system-associated protein [Kordiimonadaceae bacterium]MBO6965480.1 FemAB family PEP-CTERM system-associated protein [Kordiimonadaceae bacterium]